MFSVPREGGSGPREAGEVRERAQKRDCQIPLIKNLKIGPDLKELGTMRS
jgi:hypothetical protein